MLERLNAYIENQVRTILSSLHPNSSLLNKTLEKGWEKYLFSSALGLSLAQCTCHFSLQTDLMAFSESLACKLFIDVMHLS